MKKLLAVSILLMVMMLLFGCGDSDLNVPESENAKKEIVVEEFTSNIGYIIENNVYDYSQCFDVVYEWTEGVKLPFDKPNNAEVYLEEYKLVIKNLETGEFEKYIKGLENKGFLLNEASFENLEPDELKHTRYILYQNNLVVIMDKYVDEIRVYLTTGNVIAERDVTVDRLREMLGKDYADDVIIEIAYDTVYKAGYCEFLVIPLEYYTTVDTSVDVSYVIANEDQILLCEEGIWNPIYPMTVVLQSVDKEVELTIIYNDLPGSRSGQSVYPGINKYVLKDESFLRLENEYSLGDRVLVGKLENEELKYYEVKVNEDFNVNEGYKTYWRIDKEYKIE